MLSLIFAIDPDGVIGKNNDLPWHYPQDLRYFKKTTLHHRVLMGSNTYRSILARLGHPLPERENLVATHRPEAFPGVRVITDLEAFLKTPHPDEVFVIGGKAVFEQAWPYADRLYVTHVLARHDGDVRLACFDLASFRTLSVREDDELIFAVYERIR
jgi:dihydrofolate reductase